MSALHLFVINVVERETSLTDDIIINLKLVIIYIRSHLTETILMY